MHARYHEKLCPFKYQLTTMAPAHCGLDITPDRAEINTLSGLSCCPFPALLSSHPVPPDRKVTYLKPGDTTPKTEETTERENKRPEVAVSSSIQHQQAQQPDQTASAPDLPKVHRSTTPPPSWSASST
ncbi:hypothetical protein CHARACLAT_005728 [Characodon lateralis]|uniref:Uncharacterized protein n=1 Tax=Characodon lateralis TaxID=208331 RepID=A0ABU7D6T2_9TELE|nr:hypothetical protein [Characodon lateralis]